LFNWFKVDIKNIKKYFNIFLIKKNILKNHHFPNTDCASCSYFIAFSSLHDDMSSTQVQSKIERPPLLAYFADLLYWVNYNSVLVGLIN
jgi:hypothetical protein